MKKLFNSVAFKSTATENHISGETREIKYSIHEGYKNKPYLHLVMSSPSEGGGTSDMTLDISREDIIEILNDIVDEWPEIVDSYNAPLREGIEVIPVFR
jgi:hypothetical protein